MSQIQAKKYTHFHGTFQKYSNEITEEKYFVEPCLDGGDPCNGEEAQRYPGLVCQAMSAAGFRKDDIQF